MKYLALSVIHVLVFIAMTGEAAANMAQPSYYEAELQGNTVIVESSYHLCPDEMLRKNVETGEIVLLSEFCEGDRFVDECVAPGEYIYSSISDFPCTETPDCEVESFARVTVLDALSADCELSDGNDGVEPYNDTIATQKCHCDDDEESGGCSMVKTPTNVFGLNLLFILLGVSVLWFRSRSRLNEYKKHER